MTEKILSDEFTQQALATFNRKMDRAFGHVVAEKLTLQAKAAIHEIVKKLPAQNDVSDIVARVLGGAMCMADMSPWHIPHNHRPTAHVLEKCKDAVIHNSSLS